MKITEKVFQTIIRNSLPLSNVRLLVALSGGADSVALLRVLLTLGYTCEAAHCNFHLRGDESDRDEFFVRNLCTTLEIPLHVTHFATREYATNKKVSVEMAARTLRYKFFSDLLNKGRGDFVAVAHHRDDNAETILLNLVRGTGMRGLCGMKYMNNRVIRPMLDVSRLEILNYLEEIGQNYVTDSTNLLADVTRNRIRLQILPLLRKLNPSIEETLHREAKKMGEAMSLYRHTADSVLSNVICMPDGSELLAVSVVPSNVSMAGILFEWLYSAGFNETQVNNAAEAVQRGKLVRFESDNNVLFFDGNCFCLSPKLAFTDIKGLELPEQGEISVNDRISFVVERRNVPIPAYELRDPANAFIDIARISIPLTVRSFHNGDRFVPYGMSGSKLVSDFLADRKIPLWQRMKQLIVADKNKIVWVVGERIDDRVKILSDTKEAIMLKCVFS